MPEQPDSQKYIWKEIYQVTQLHRELASLYRTKSTDRRTINALWNAIEEKEAILFLEGIDLS